MSNYTGMTRIAPGAYDDGRGGLHLDVAEMLAAAGAADTIENRETLIAAARQLFAAEYALTFHEDASPL